MLECRSTSETLLNLPAQLRKIDFHSEGKTSNKTHKVIATKYLGDPLNFLFIKFKWYRFFVYFIDFQTCIKPLSAGIYYKKKMYINLWNIYIF